MTKILSAVTCSTLNTAILVGPGPDTMVINDTRSLTHPIKGLGGRQGPTTNCVC